METSKQTQEKQNMEATIKQDLKHRQTCLRACNNKALALPPETLGLNNAWLISDKSKLAQSQFLFSTTSSVIVVCYKFNFIFLNLK